MAISAICAMAIIGFILSADQTEVDKLIFYAPAMIILVGLLTIFYGRKVGLADRRAVAFVTVFAWAAFMESFPRFAREQAVAAMPFVILLLFYLICVYKPSTDESISMAANRAICPLHLAASSILDGRQALLSHLF